MCALQRRFVITRWIVFTVGITVHGNQDTEIRARKPLLMIPNKINPIGAAIYLHNHHVAHWES